MDEDLIKILDIILPNIDKGRFIARLYDLLSEDDTYELVRNLSENGADLDEFVNLTYNNHFEQFITKLIESNSELDINYAITTIAKSNKNYLLIEESGIVNRMKYEYLKEHIEDIDLTQLEQINKNK
jgi:hypothetical protein